MEVTLLKQKQLYTLSLPPNIQGSYCIYEYNQEHRYELLRIDAMHGQWVLSENEYISILNEQLQPQSSVVLQSQGQYLLTLRLDHSRAMVIVDENTNLGMQRFVFEKGTSISIGRSTSCDIQYHNAYVSNIHAQLYFDGCTFRVKDCGSVNGVYCNGVRIKECELTMGDFVYIMGLKLIIGPSFITICGNQNHVRILSNGIRSYEYVRKREQNCSTNTTPTLFYRSLQLQSLLQRECIVIESAPVASEVEPMPMVYDLISMIVMATPSIVMVVFSFVGMRKNPESITQMLPSMIMSVCMVLSTCLIPIFWKQYERKNQKRKEAKRVKRYREYLEEIKKQIQQQQEQLQVYFRQMYFDVSQCFNIAYNRNELLWSRSAEQEQFLTISIGIGTWEEACCCSYTKKGFCMDVDPLYEEMEHIANTKLVLQKSCIPLNIKQHCNIGVYGEQNHGMRMLNTLLTQIVTLHGYDEVKLMFFLREEEEVYFRYWKYLPHVFDQERTIRFFASTKSQQQCLNQYIEQEVIHKKGKEHYVIVSTCRNIVEKYCGIYKLMNAKEGSRCSIIEYQSQINALSKDFTTIIHANGMQSSLYVDGTTIAFAQEELASSQQEVFMLALANTTLYQGTKQYFIKQISFLDLYEVGKIEHLNVMQRWNKSNVSHSLQALIGLDEYQEGIYLDIHEQAHGPHGLVAGMTGSGKSEFLITYMLSMAINYHPHEVSFVIIDYKGGGLLSAFVDESRGIMLPHLAGSITNLDKATIQRCLISIQSECERRQKVFQEACKIAQESVMDIYKYQQLVRANVLSEPMSHLIIVCDEFAELKSQQSEFIEQLISTSRIGRSLGIHLILATQKPSGVVDDQIWSNSKFRICLKVQEKSDSIDMIKCEDGAYLTQAGRFYLQVGYNELFLQGQSAWCGARYHPQHIYQKQTRNEVRLINQLAQTLSCIKQSDYERMDVEKSQSVALLTYLSTLASEEGICAKPLWLDELSSNITLESLEQSNPSIAYSTQLEPIIGVYDDPYQQKQACLRVPLTKEGNAIVFGMSGSGKTMFLTTLIASLITHHENLCLYLLDFEKETLQSFQQVKQVQQVYTSCDEDAIKTFVMDLYREIGIRKESSSYEDLVVVIHNYACFYELCEDVIDLFIKITREGFKYGIYIVISANSSDEISYRLLQNFKNRYVLQCNDRSEYAYLLGKEEHRVPSKFVGRGLCVKEHICEFQCACVQNLEKYVQAWVKETTIKVLGKKSVNSKDVVLDCSHVMMGVHHQREEVVSIDFTNVYIFCVLMESFKQNQRYLSSLQALWSRYPNTIMVTEGNDAFSEWIQEMYDERDHNTQESICILIGFSKIVQQLKQESKLLLLALLEQWNVQYKLHFILVDELACFEEYTYESWYVKHCGNNQGCWIGKGINEQYVFPNIFDVDLLVDQAILFTEQSYQVMRCFFEGEV